MTGGPISDGLDMIATIKISTTAAGATNVDVKDLLHAIEDLKNEPKFAHLAVKIVYRGRVEKESTVNTAAVLPPKP